MTFRGGPVEALGFFEGLEVDNSKTNWLGTHRAEDRLIEFFRLSEPLCGWPREHVGPPNG